MRKQTHKLVVDDLEWSSTGAPGLFEKLLNEDHTTGARTVILKSMPRPRPAGQKPQYHPVDEEFFCLSGGFTLEAGTLLEDDSYVYYPANLVHGFCVDVPSGYEIYLRNSGPLSTTHVEHPVEDSSYLAGPANGQAANSVVFHARESLDRARGEGNCSVVVLRKARDGHDGAILVTLPRDDQITVTAGKAGSFIELFLLSGEIEIEQIATLGERNYAFLDLATPAVLRGKNEVSTFLVNYNSDEVLEQFAAAATTRATVSSHECTGHRGIASDID
jgi:hypothetical protein